MVTWYAVRNGISYMKEQVVTTLAEQTPWQSIKITNDSHIHFAYTDMNEATPQHCPQH